MKKAHNFKFLHLVFLVVASSAEAQKMSDQPLPNPVADPYGYLMLIPNPDGTITRKPDAYPRTAPTLDPTSPVLSKDIPINQSSKTWVRLYLPREALDHPSDNNKLPLIVYIHGGGFILLSAATSHNHDFCSNIAAGLPSVVVSVEYRLAPEHRLPAAYDDTVEALHWIKTTDEAWLRQYADYSNCFLMGTSAGGNIAYVAGLRAAAEIDNLQPLKIKGMILHHPFFGGVKRCESEVRLVNDPVLPPIVSDVMWDLSLPSGVDRDHEYCNPAIGGGAKELDLIKLLGWKVLVTGCDGDPLIDRQIEVVRLMKEKGIDVTGGFGEGDFHGVEMVDPSKQKVLIEVVRTFVSNSILSA